MADDEKYTDAEKRGLDAAREVMRQARELQEAGRENGSLFEMIDSLPPEVQGEYRQQAADATGALLDALEKMMMAAQENISRETTGVPIGDNLATLARLTAGTTQEAIGELKKHLDAEKLAAEAPADELEAALAAINDQVQESNRRVEGALKKTLNFALSDAFGSLQESLDGFSEWFRGLLQKEVSEMSRDELTYLGDFSEDMETLTAFIQEEIEAYKKESGAGRITVEEFFNATDPETGEPVESIYDRVLRQAQERAGATADAANNIISIGAHRVMELDYPLDKVNDSIWSLLKENTHGQLELNISAGTRKQAIDIVYSINFDAIESESAVLKRLTQYDKRVYLAIGGLYDAGNAIVTLAMIYQAMGYKGEPGRDDREKINKALTKMGAWITLDNWQEISANFKYPKYDYDGPLLPFERLTPKDGEILINGERAKEYIHIFREPPLLTFAKGRGQITTIEQKLFRSPLRKTEQNLAIEDYCLVRIAQHKREGRKILMETLYKKCNITDRKAQERTPEKIKRLFDYYKQCGEIKSYKLTAEAITFEPQEKIADAR